ncbi:hypothetical protein DL93DRAFT_2042058, partial [Clavulina sp. PMI_390]
GGSCNPALTRLDAATHKLLSDCGDKAYCNNGTCEQKGCRQYDHDITYGPNDYIPPFCPSGTYCPDVQNSCQPLLPLGASCELDRDDECAPLASNISGVSNQIICLQYVCRLATSIADQPCIIEDTQYAASYMNGTIGTQLISRDNCWRPSFWCNRTSLLCQATVGFGSPCDEDRECFSSNCDVNSKTCDRYPQDPIPISPVAYSVTATLFSIMLGSIIFSLFLCHNRQREARRKERQDYWDEQ